MNNEYAGMTVNERLYVSGYMDEFDMAIHNKDIEKIKSILKIVELDEISIKAILAEYGFES